MVQPVALTRENLRGVWAAIATPFDEHDQIDEESFRENVRRLAAAGVDGIYTTDSDGEFYGLDLDEFKRLVDIFADETARIGIPTQVGVTWTNTAGMIDRIRHAADRGILGAHIGHPYFMDMTSESYRQFWLDIAGAVPSEFALIHYNTPRVHNTQTGADYAQLSELLPNLVGTKQVTSSFPEFLSITQQAPDLAHFTGEHALVPFTLFGAVGLYSWLVNFNAPYVVAWYQECLAGNLEAAARRQIRVNAMNDLKLSIFGRDNYHAILNKGMAAASEFLVGHHRTRRPYLPVPDAKVAEFRRRMEEDFPDLVWHPQPAVVSGDLMSAKA
ncbi:MAG TPA: dihydrodipicolinate synthase family protein [Thermomicrobiales bacterium]|nr:dihydrodipicolinate synthase family protein [Thermomicrobiales bacterium]